MPPVTTADLALPLATIEPDPDQPRKSFDPSAMAELVLSIKTEGVLEPIVVTPNPDPKAQTKFPYRILFGERRYRAAAEAGLATIPAVVDDRPLAGLDRLAVQLAENDERNGLSLLERASALAHRLESTPGLTARELARRLHLSPSYLSNLLTLASYDGPARTAIEEGRIVRAETARQFRALPLSVQKTLLSISRSRGDQITPQVLAAARDRCERRGQAEGSATDASPELHSEAPLRPPARLVPRKASRHLELDLAFLDPFLLLAGLTPAATPEDSVAALNQRLTETLLPSKDDRS
jgi:ParB family transcriptional regulator, chromosome partitioning protein